MNKNSSGCGPFSHCGIRPPRSQTAAMTNINEDTITIEVEIDDETEAHLLRLSRVCGDSPGKIAASLLHDILADDQTFNEVEAIRPASLN